jgi:hypothetical protein
MTPQIPPKALVLVCRLPKAAQAEAIGVAHRQFNRLLQKPWSEWRVGQAERWCSACGLTFWRLHFNPELVSRVDWKAAENVDSPESARYGSLVLDALRDLFFLVYGKKAQKPKLLKFGRDLASGFTDGGGDE